MQVKLTHHRLSYSFSHKQIPDYPTLLKTAQRLFVGGPQLEQRLHYLVKEEPISINSQQTFLRAVQLFPNDLEVHCTQPEAKLEAGTDKDRLTIPEIVGKYKPKGPVVGEPDWDEDEWLRYITQRIDRGRQEDIRREVKLHTRVSKKSSTNFAAKELEDDVLKEIEACASKADRVTHSEDGAGSFLLSLYEMESRIKKIPVEDCCKKLWKLDSWRNTKRQDKSTKEITKLNLTKKEETIIPFLYAANKVELEEEAEPSSFLFASPPKPQQKPKQQRSKIEYFLMDRLYHIVLVIHQMEKGDKVTLEQIKGLISVFREYSDWDYQFVIKVVEAYAEYAQGGDIYKPPTSDRSGVLPQFDDNEKVGIIGDWGTGFRDAFDLLDELVLNQNATIVLHLGDVYYAGFPEEFKRISDHINALQRIKPKFRYYAIPGNHDYYTFGGPFQTHLALNNLDQRMTQTHSFFCLRNRSHTVQFLGIDTGINEHSFITPLNPFHEGAVLETPEAQWAIARVKEFPGRTIMLSHHPLFSVFENTIGKTTDFSWQDPQLSFHLAEDLFQILPKITCWFWGHEHRFAVHRQNAYGINKSILLGNGSFQNNEESYYQPLYNQGDLVQREFFPDKDDRGYYHHTAALMTNFTNYEISLKYIYMTSSYTEPAEKTREESDTVSQPVPQPVLLGTPYHLQEQSGLSLCTLKGQLWLHYTPTFLQFKRADLPAEDGELRTGVDFLMQVGDSKRYLYYSSWGFVELGDYDSESSSEKHKYRWRIDSAVGERTILTGDTFELTSVHRKGKIGREFHLNYFRLSYAEKPSRFQIYRRFGEEQTVKLFSQQQEEPKTPATGRCAECCELM